MAVRNKNMVVEALAPWGRPGTPLLPESLRALWSGDSLPAWVLKELRLPSGATFEALGSGLKYSGQPAAAARLRNFVVNAVLARRRSIELVEVFTRSWPLTLDPAGLPFTSRTRNCLDRAGLLKDRALMKGLTFAQLFDIPAMGVVSVLDFACVSEAAMDLVAEYQLIDTAAASGASTDALVKAIDKSWAGQVSAMDPRFADVLPPGEGTVFERIEQLTAEPTVDPSAEEVLASAVVAVERRAGEIASASLDEALKEFARALSGFQGRKLEALLARLGWSGEPPSTLEQAGRLMGVSRERMRQLQERVEKRIPEHQVFMPSLDRALDLIASRAPMSVEEAGSLLETSNVSSVSFHPESLLSAAAACRRMAPFTIETIRGQSRVVTRPYGEHAAAIISIAHRQASASGASNLQEVTAEVNAAGIAVVGDTVREVLSLFSDIEFLDDDWFWYSKGKPQRNRVRNMTRKMLSVASPISVSALREGLRRQYRFRGSRGLGTWPLVVPPRSVLRRLYEVHPEFLVDEHGNVRPVFPLDYREELIGTEQVLVDVLRSSPACVLDRASCARACVERGMNQNTFSLYLTYSPIIAHLGTDIWSLRGVQVDPAAIEAVREANAARVRERSVVDHGWTPEGNLWVAARLPYTIGSFVCGIPGAIRRLVAGREFPASDENGTGYGTIRVSDEGTSYGYGPFLSRRGADEDDILVVEFDLANQQAVLKLGDDEILEGMNPA